MGTDDTRDFEKALARCRFKPSNESRMVGYARVSTEDQNLDMQIASLINAGCAPENIYTEHVSGAAKNRPRLEAAASERTS